MADLPVELAELISSVDRSDAEPLELVTEAVIVSGRLGELADEVVDHFVRQARASGASWAEIGQSMGVSKQAAQKRFVGERRSSFKLSGSRLFTRFSTEAKATVQAAVGYAHNLRSEEIGTVHLVMALAAPGSGLAHMVIDETTGSAEELANVAESSLDEPNRSRKVKHIPFSKEARKVLELSLREAIRDESRDIGTEHLLLGLLRDESSAGAKVFVEHGVTMEAVEQWLEENLNGH